jgi:hypothetical protein
MKPNCSTWPWRNLPGDVRKRQISFSLIRIMIPATVLSCFDEQFGIKTNVLWKW